MCVDKNHVVLCCGFKDRLVLSTDAYLFRVGIHWRLYVYGGGLVPFYLFLTRFHSSRGKISQELVHVV